MFLTNLLFIDFQEIVIILVVVVMLFGTKSLPEIARGLGEAVRHFRIAADEIKNEIINPSEVLNPVESLKNEVKKNIDDIGNEIKEETNEIQNSVSPIEGTIKRDV